MKRRTHKKNRYLTEQEVAALQRAASGETVGKRATPIDFDSPVHESADLWMQKIVSDLVKEVDTMKVQRDAFRDDAIFWFTYKFNRRST